MAGQPLILGLGATGLSLVRYFVARGQLPILTDTRKAPPLIAQLNSQYPQVPFLPVDDFVLEDHPIDTAYASPGFPVHHPLLDRLTRAHIPIHNDIELFCKHNPAKPVVAITGTNGKSTVCAMLKHALSKHGIAAVAAGNFGTPVLDLIDHDTSQLWLLEMSSFQLLRVDSLRDHIAAILNIAPDHLDSHRSMAEYQHAKQRIYRNSRVQVCNSDDPHTWVQADDTGRVYWFGLHQPPPDGKIQHFATLRNGYYCFGNTRVLAAGKTSWSTHHQNLLATIAVLASMQLLEAARSLTGFQHLQHRCQTTGHKLGRHFINDSKATNPHAAIHAIISLATEFDDLVVIAGGDAKNLALEELGATLAQHAKALVAMGKDADALIGTTSGLPSKRVTDMQQAVRTAIQMSAPGDCIALCPGCASTDMFRDYIDRGKQFTACVAAL